MYKNFVELGLLKMPEGEQPETIPEPTPDDPFTAGRPQEALYVSADLKLLPITFCILPAEMQRDGINYRRLDPQLYAWFHQRMNVAKRKHETGQLPDTEWNRLRQAFNAMQEKAVNLLGKPALETALQIGDSDLHPFVKEHRYPKEGSFNHSYHVSPAALKKVNAVKEKALSLGWSEERLYRNRCDLAFPLGQQWGLACFLEANCRIGEITERSIEIIHGSKQGEDTILRFYNPDVLQPWTSRELRK